MKTGLDFDEETEGDMDAAKAIPETNIVHIYDRRMRCMIKRKVGLDKKEGGYAYFLHGCRCVLIKDNLYITGGVDKEKREQKICYVYNAKTNEIELLPNMLFPHAYHAIEYLKYYKY